MPRNRICILLPKYFRSIHAHPQNFYANLKGQMHSVLTGSNFLQPHQYAPWQLLANNTDFENDKLLHYILMTGQCLVYKICLFFLKIIHPALNQTLPALDKIYFPYFESLACFFVAEKKQKNNLNFFVYHQALCFEFCQLYCCVLSEGGN